MKISITYLLATFFFFHLTSDSFSEVLCVNSKGNFRIASKCVSPFKKASVSVLSKLGLKGETGPSSATGPKGDTGAQGQAGSNGISGRVLEESSDTVTVASGATTGVFVTCSGIKKPTGGGCESSDSRLVVYYGYPDETASFYSYFCGFRNISGTSVNATITAHAVCALNSN